MVELTTCSRLSNERTTIRFAENRSWKSTGVSFLFFSFLFSLFIEKSPFPRTLQNVISDAEFLIYCTVRGKLTPWLTCLPTVEFLNVEDLRSSTPAGIICDLNFFIIGRHAIAEISSSDRFSTNFHSRFNTLFLIHH